MLRRPFEPPPTRRRPLTWASALAGVAVGQALVFMALSLASPAPPAIAPASVMLVELIPPPPPPPEPLQAEEPAPEATTRADASQDAEPAPEVATAPVPTPRPRPPAAPRAPRLVPPPQVETLAATPVPGPPNLPLVGGARLARALRAGGGGTGQGSGGGSGDGGGGGSGGQGQGGACDMAARLQAALRDDSAIRRAVTETLRAQNAEGQAVLVWDGDWLQSPGEEGKGLAGLRQAVAVEVGFAPRACREEPVRGLVVLALDGSSHGPKVALGAANWRWRDLLGL